MHSTLTRALTFHARHRYVREEWSETKNRERFGWTTEAPGHGHLYRVEVTVAGVLDPETSMIIDLPELDRILAEAILTPFDGQYLNEVVPDFAAGRQLPTCEAIAALCWHDIAERLPAAVLLERVRVGEDESLWADCTAQPPKPYPLP